MIHNLNTVLFLAQFLLNPIWKAGIFNVILFVKLMGKRKIAKTFPIFIQTFKTLKYLSVKVLENCFRTEFQ